MSRLAAICVGMVLISAWFAQAAVAQVLRLPDHAQEIARETFAPDSYALPLGPWADGDIPVRVVEGRVTRKTWRIPAQGITTLQVLKPLRAQLVEAGYDLLFECAARACGGFDFRFGTEVLAAPDMYVNLADFRFLSADKEGRSHVGLLVSRSDAAGFVQLIHVAPADAVTPDSAFPKANETPEAAPGSAPSLGRTLREHGHAVLSDLVFDTGSSALGEGDFPSLASLASFLAANPDRRVVLVGHTDTVGSLERNIELSRARAASVLERMATLHGIDRTQISAEGVGYLVPRASNETEVGREANRRVEAVLLPAP